MPDILLDDSAGVRTLTLNRPEKKNAFTAAMYATLSDALAEAAADDAVRVVVLQGQVQIFSAGNDIADFLEQPPTGPDAPVFRLLRQLATFAKPLLAAVCGPAVGIGTTLLLHCDLVVAGDNAAFSLPFVNLGVAPEAGASLLLPQLMGYQRAAEALLLGEPFLAEAAQEVGLVNRIVVPNEANAVAQALARKLAAKPQTALLETKRLLKMGRTDALLARMDEEIAVFGKLLAQAPAQDALHAFLNKRKA